MWIQLYFILSSLETLALLAYTILEKSLPEESILLNYSGERLALIAGITIIFLFFVILTWHSFSLKSSLHQRIYQTLKDPRFIWSTLFINVVLAVVIDFLFTQPPGWFGSSLTLFTRLQPLLYWLQVLNGQSFIFALVFYCVVLIQTPENGTNSISLSELDVLMLIFLGAVLLKLAFVLPGTYGLYKDVGESKYFNMIFYLFDGRFYNAADDVTTHYPFLYPMMLLFTYFVKNYTFNCIMLVNCIFTSSIIFPLYLLARRFLDRQYSLFLAIVVCLIPFQFLIPNRLLSENLYFPLLLWALYLAFVTPADNRQRILWDALTGLFFGLLYLTRFISLAIIPFLLLIWWLKPFEEVTGAFQWNWKKAGHAILILLITALVYSPWVYIGLTNGLSLKETLGFGIAANTNPQQLTFANLLTWVLLYGCYYLLLAAPVLNLIIIALRTFPLTDLKNENSRWLLSLALLLLGFSLAVVRHSWRASYNLDLPLRIMGRYVIYFVPLFLMSGFIGLCNFDRNKFRSFFHFLVCTTLLQFALVTFSYLLIISGKIIPIGENFVEPLISIDGFYIQQLGVYFFVFILILYIGGAYILWNQKHQGIEFLTCVLVAFYLFAAPDCMDLLKQQSTYQKLGYTLSEAMLNAAKDGGKKEYVIYFSDGISAGNRKDFAWSLYVRNLDCDWQIVKYPAVDKPDLVDENGFVIYPLSERDVARKAEMEYLNINGEKFVVELNLQ